MDKTTVLVGKACVVSDHTTYSHVEQANELHERLDQLHWVKTLKEALGGNMKVQALYLAYLPTLPERRTPTTTFVRFLVLLQ